MNTGVGLEWMLCDSGWRYVRRLIWGYVVGGSIGAEMGVVSGVKWEDVKVHCCGVVRVGWECCCFWVGLSVAIVWNVAVWWGRD